MIEDSAPWKDDLVRLSQRLRARYNQKRWPARSLFLLEKEIFGGCFAVRKLIESKKVSDRLTTGRKKIAVYPAGEKEITLLNQHRFPELYNLYARTTELLGIEQICNLFIHSAIFGPFIPFGQSLVGVYITSDWHRKKKLYYIPLHFLIEIFQSVGNNYPDKVSVTWNGKLKKYVIRNA